MLENALIRQPEISRYLCHLRQRLEQSRLNLVTGAGISLDAKVPGWEALLERLCESDVDLAADFKKHQAARRPPEYLGQIIYHRKRDALPNNVEEHLRQVTIDHQWAGSVHDALYKDVPKTMDDILSKHPYLSNLRDFARKLPLVINFNFDDILSASIEQDISKSASGRALSVVWRPPLVERPNVTTVYHVNGVLPRASLKKRSDQLIFTEDSFADALVRSPGIDADYTFLRFVQNTMILIGHSLGDSSLKNYLRRNRDKSPANHHYMIYWIKTEADLSESLRQDIFNANIELYNLITIFLTSKEINEFLQILNLEARIFSETIDRLGAPHRSCFRYYIVGLVAAGKSTLLEHLRCFETHEEWTSSPPSEMYRSFKSLNSLEQEKVDDFIYRELKEKNTRMQNSKLGFYFMDRAPLDLYAFSTGKSERRKKTQQLKEKVVRDDPLVHGEIIFIYANGSKLVERNLRRGRPPESSGEAKYLNNQTRKLRLIYNPQDAYCTDAYSAGELARKVARRVLMGNYTPADLTNIMNRNS